ncbi:unnamed protein product, partial [Medioppia subpectinata]
TVAAQDMELAALKQKCKRWRESANLSNRELVSNKFVLQRVEAMYESSAAVVADIVEDIARRAINGVNRQLQDMTEAQTAAAADRVRHMWAQRVVIDGKANDMTRDPNKFQCPECRKEYKGHICLVKHIARTHPRVTPMDTTGATTASAPVAAVSAPVAANDIVIEEISLSDDE